LKPRYFSVKNGFFIVLLLALMLAIYVPVMHTMYYLHIKQEFVSHARFADQYLRAPGSILPHIMAHPLLFLSEAALIVVFKIDYVVAGFIALTLAYLAQGLIIYNEVLKRLRALSRRPELWSLGLTMALMIVAQIPILLSFDRQIYFGYIGINAYNNSTMNYLKPFALASFLYTLKVFAETRPGWKDILISALLMALSSLVKPNYVICLLPGLGLLVLIKLWKREKLQWWFMMLGVVLPAVLTLGWQYKIDYGAGAGGIFFAPLVVKYYYSDALIVKFFFSILFPFLATRVYIRQAVRDDKMLLAWFCFIAGAFYAYFLSETSGGAITMGNFDWSAEATLFILFIVVTLFWLEQLAGKKKWEKKDTALAAAFGAHVISGILFYLFALSIDNYSEVASFSRIFDVFFNK
jgi:hypothetical protein